MSLKGKNWTSMNFVQVLMLQLFYNNASGEEKKSFVRLTPGS
jgi:hypothetical protein